MGDDTVSDEALDDEILLMKELDEVQRRTGTPFGVPERISPADRAGIKMACELLRGRSVEVPPTLKHWTLARPRDLPEAAAQYLQVDERIELALKDPNFTVEIFGQPVPLGAAEVTMPASQITAIVTADEESEDQITAQPFTPAKRRRVRLLDPSADGC
ncbi:hypothetical protein [Streptomyces sp. NPDC050392]|uniref:hypothetical protein n=1 Tax=Streptomyces sp. NPDC050392 TaxID=3155782 RepID=UPI003428EC92